MDSVVKKFGTDPLFTAITINVDASVVDGVDQSFPPLAFDETARHIHGGVEVRTTSAEGFPNDVVVVKLETRTERPVNWIDVEVFFDAQTVNLVDIQPLYPEFHLRTAGDHFTSVFNGSPVAGYNGRLRFRLTLEGGSNRPYSVPHVAPSLRYVDPLNEWVELADLHFWILPSQLTRPESPLRVKVSAADFAPYLGNNSNFGFVENECRERTPPWMQDPVIETSSKITVLGHGGNEEPIPPPLDPALADIRVEIGSSLGVRGELVRLPVVLQSGLDLYQVRLALGYDQESLVFERFELSVQDPDGMDGVAPLHAESPVSLSQFCDGEGLNRICRYGFPAIGQLRGPPHDEVPPAVVLVDLLGSLETALGRVWSAGERYTLGNLVFRVREDAPSGAAHILGVEVTWTASNAAGPSVTETSGYPTIVTEGPRLDVPAIEVVRGEVLIDGVPFLRADSDLNGSVELTDAIRTLGALFLGTGPVPCEDAADANDDGTLDLSDAVFTLFYLFSGGAAPPAPFPNAGLDPTVDELDCFPNRPGGAE